MSQAKIPGIWQGRGSSVHSEQTPLSPAVFLFAPLEPHLSCHCFCRHRHFAAGCTGTKGKWHLEFQYIKPHQVRERMFLCLVPAGGSPQRPPCTRLPAPGHFTVPSRITAGRNVCTPRSEWAPFTRQPIQGGSVCPIFPPFKVKTAVRSTANVQ